MIDEKAYKELVDEVSASWEQTWESNLKPKMKWYSKCKQINLWTYWQGINVKKVDILVVGQDWGRPCWPDFDAKESLKQIDDNVSQINAGKADVLYLSPGISSPWPTDRNLSELIKEIKLDGKSLYVDVNSHRYDNLFFTNFCLGYRRDKETGEMTQRKMMRNAAYFKKLVKCLNPQIIICLGKDTYECVLKTLFEKSQNLSFKEYVVLLNKGENRTEEIFNGNKIIVYGMGHCGAMGVNINRKKFVAEDYPELAVKTGMELMKEDWSRISSDVKRLGINSHILA